MIRLFPTELRYPYIYGNNCTNTAHSPFDRVVLTHCANKNIKMLFRDRSHKTTHICIQHRLMLALECSIYQSLNTWSDWLEKAIHGVKFMADFNWWIRQMKLYVSFMFLGKHQPNQEKKFYQVLRILMSIWKRDNGDTYDHRHGCTRLLNMRWDVGDIHWDMRSIKLTTSRGCRRPNIGQHLVRQRHCCGWFADDDDDDLIFRETDTWTLRLMLFGTWFFLSFLYFSGSSQLQPHHSIKFAAVSVSSWSYFHRTHHINSTSDISNASVSRIQLWGEEKDGTTQTRSLYSTHSRRTSIQKSADYSVTWDWLCV